MAVADPASELEALPRVRHGGAEPAQYPEKRTEVVVRPERGRVEIVFEGYGERSFEKNRSFAHTVAMVGENQTLAVHGLRERLRLVEGLGERESALEVRQRALLLSREDEVAAELSRDGCNVRRSSRCLQRCQRRLEPRHRLRRMAVDEVAIGQARRDPGSGNRVPELLVGRMRPVEQSSGLADFVGTPSHISSACRQLGPGPLVVGKLSRLLEVALRLRRRREAGRPLAGAHERLPRACLQLLGVVGARHRLEGREQVGGDHLRDLVLAERCRKLVRGREMTALPVVP